MSTAVTVVTVATTLACGLVGGVFFAFSNFVMAALGRRPDREAIAAMQTINVTVINPVFMTALFGTVVPCVGLAAWAVAAFGDDGAAWVLGGSASYAVGCAGVTMAANVPLNEELRRQDAEDAGAAEVWRRYLRRWTAWNTVRTVASLLAAGLLMVGAVQP